MLIIRLRRSGKKGEPHYRLVVQEKRSKLNGKYLESIGHYHPLQAENKLTVNNELALKWLGQGAATSTTVNNLLVKAGVFTEDKKISKVYSVKSKKKKEASEDKKSETKETEAETPKEKETKASETAEEPVSEEKEPAPDSDNKPKEMPEETPAQ